MKISELIGQCEFQLKTYGGGEVEIDVNPEDGDSETISIFSVKRQNDSDGRISAKIVAE